MMGDGPQLLHVPDAAIKAIRAVLTVVGGRIVHDAGALRASSPLGRGRHIQPERRGGDCHATVVGDHGDQILAQRARRREMDGVQAPQRARAQEPGVIEQFVVQRYDVDTLQELPGSRQRGSSLRSHCTDYFGASEAARSPIGVPLEVPRQGSRLRFAHHELYEGRRVKVDHWRLPFGGARRCQFLRRRRCPCSGFEWSAEVEEIAASGGEPATRHQ